MIAIINVDPNCRMSGPHKYTIGINRTIYTEFTHNREEPLSVCLLKAAIAAEEWEKQPKGKRMIIPEPPRYDDVYIQGMRWLDSL